MPPRVKEEERIERIIRDLLKLPENRRCINCNSLGPQYVCTTFWTFVCTNCSGVHREFTHRVKSVSIAKFNAAEVNTLQAGGNERARQIYFKAWDPQRDSFPDGTNLHRLRDFIKHVYVDRKYSGENNSLPMVRTKPKGDTYEQNSFKRAGSLERDDSKERQSFEKSTPSVRDNERTLRYFMEERSPQSAQENVRSGSHSHRGRSSSRFEIVDDRYRDDGGVRRFERYPSRESRSTTPTMSPSSRRIWETNSPVSSPAIRPVKDFLGEKVVPLRIAEPPKANDKRSADASAHDQKTEVSNNPHSENVKPKENKTVDCSSLIDFDAKPVTPPKAEPQAQEKASSEPSSAVKKASNAPNLNSLDSLLFELSTPVVSSGGNTPQIPAITDVLSGASVALPRSSESKDATSWPKVSEVFEPPPPTTEKDQEMLGSGNRTNSTVEVTSVKKLPYQQNLTSVSPPNNSHYNTPSVKASADQGNMTSAITGQGTTPNARSEQPSQASIRPTPDSGSEDGSKSMWRKELPADLFASNHMAFCSPVPSWNVRPAHGMGYGMQFYPASMTTAPSTNAAKPRNPFEIGDGRPEIQASMFPSMEALQGALPNMPPNQPSPSLSYVPPSMVSPYAMTVPPGAFMRQQSLDKPQVSPQEISTKVGGGGNKDAFAFLNPVHKSNSRNRYPAPTFPSSGGNPFG